MRAGCHLQGDREVMRFFRKIPNKVSGLVVTKALMSSAGVYKRAGAAKVKTENLVLTGVLKDEKNWVVKARKKKSKDKRLVVCGPRNQTYMVNLSNTKRKPIPAGGTVAAHQKIQRAFFSGAKLKRVNPGKYAWLVEHGHAGRTKKSKPVAPHPFMEPTFTSKMGIAKSAFSSTFRKHFKAEVKKFRMKRSKKRGLK